MNIHTFLYMYILIYIEGSTGASPEGSFRSPEGSFHSPEGKEEGFLEGKEGSLESSPLGGEPSLEDLFPSEETFEDSLEGLLEGTRPGDR
jgi:hypothetical protein